MNDTTKYVNAYAEVTSKLLHENLNELLQNKINIKILSDLVSEKDQIINNLTKNLEDSKNINQDMETHRRNATSWEQQYNAMKNKASHIDALSNQVNDMKRIIQEKDEIIQKLTNEITSFRNPPSIINKRKKKKQEAIMLPVVEEQTTVTNDF